MRTNNVQNFFISCKIGQSNKSTFESLHPGLFSYDYSAKLRGTTLSIVVQTVWVYMYVCMYVCMYVYVCMYMYVRTYECMYVCMYVCIYVVRTYVCICSLIGSTSEFFFL